MKRALEQFISASASAKLLYNCFDFFTPKQVNTVYNNITDYETDTYFYPPIFYV